MTQSHARAAWVAFFSVCGGAAVAGLAGLVLEKPSPVALGVAWFAGAFVAAAWVWADDVNPSEFRFTREGWSVLGWMAVFLLPPLGVVVGAVLRARGSSQGLPMIAASLAAFAVYVGLAALV